MATYFKTMDTPIGVLKLTSDVSFLKSVSFDAEIQEDASELPNVLIMAQKQLEEYFSGKRRQFDLPLDPEGTGFQHKVWKQLSEVPYGTTRSYVEIARILGSENSSRAVGMANGRNPIPVIIPCHRIIGHNGKMTGYAGGLERKKWLLLHEQQNSENGQLF
jgi:methylated-DNA-[protein]-cysteine S-methyltransferase